MTFIRSTFDGSRSWVAQIAYVALMSMRCGRARSQCTRPPPQGGAQVTGRRARDYFRVVHPGGPAIVVAGAAGPRRRTLRPVALRPRLSTGLPFAVLLVNAAARRLCRIISAKIKRLELTYSGICLMSDRLRPLGEALGPLLRKLEERVQAHQELAAGVRAALPAPEKNHVLSAGRRDATLIVSVDS